MLPNFAVYKELERVIKLNGTGMSVDKVLDAAKTITAIRVNMPENRKVYTKTLFLTEKRLSQKSDFPSLQGEIQK